MRAAVYLDQAFWRGPNQGVYAQRSFVLFLGELARHFNELTVAARLSPTGAESHYRLPASARFEPLPYYASAADPTAVLRATRDSLRRFSALLDHSDVAWLLGPHPFAVAFAQLAAWRGKPATLGVRQDLPAYIRNRRRRRPDLRLAAVTLEASYRVLARRHGAVVVGSELARHYRNARELLDIWVSLIRAEDIVAPLARPPRESDRIRLLSVGRIDAEKNPLLLPEVLAELGPDYELTVCGDGPLEAQLKQRASELGVADRLHLPGHVAMGDELMRVYRESDAFLHVSLTEGVPQVLLEAFAAATPVVATAVGGVAAAAGDAALLIPPSDAGVAAAAIRRLVSDHDLRDALVERANVLIHDHTIEAEAARVAEFLKRDADH